MKSTDVNEYINRYETRLKEYGYSPATLGWGKGGRQEIRFQILAQTILENKYSTVLDVGCGFGDLFRFLKKHQWHGTYTGIDIVPGLLKTAKEIDPQINVFEFDITSDLSFPNNENFDYVVASGVFNAKLIESNNEEHIKLALNRMYSISKVAICVDFMSTYVDYQNPAAYHTDPLWLLSVIKGISKRVTLRHDYMPFEFAIIVYKDDTVSTNNVFNGYLKSVQL